ncbi:MAG: metallophosphoesterase [bacterium]|nr:metallophosphoesterase [bacterium]
MLFFRICIVVISLLLVYVIWQVWELLQFNQTVYEIQSDKLCRTHTWIVLSDLHLWQYGRKNTRLISAIRDAAPDLILVPGDFVVTKKHKKFHVAQHLFDELVKIAPVYVSNGNHESRCEQAADSPYQMNYLKLKQHMIESGVHFLNNNSENVFISADEIAIWGLEIPLENYKKGCYQPIPEGFLVDELGVVDEDKFNILLAHNPRYIPQYFEWGASLTLCGHYHGGLVCIPKIGSVISPQFEWFPKYSFGRFHADEQTAIVSRGLGTHTFHIRIFNRSELVIIKTKH